MLGHDNLENHYKTNFNMMQFHKYGLSDIENMIPWERFLYIDLLKDHIRKENERIKDQQLMQRRR